MKDYAVWRRAFDSRAPLLEAAGVLGTWIVRADNDPNDILIINTWPSKENWDAFIESHHFKGKDDIKRAQEKGGVIGEPEFVGGDVAEK